MKNILTKIIFGNPTKPVDVIVPGFTTINVNHMHTSYDLQQWCNDVRFGVLSSKMEGEWLRRRNEYLSYVKSTKGTKQLF